MSSIPDYKDNLSTWWNKNKPQNQTIDVKNFNTRQEAINDCNEWRKKLRYITAPPPCEESVQKAIDEGRYVILDESKTMNAGLGIGLVLLLGAGFLMVNRKKDGK